jgi:large conductance mechanosensitive channel
MTVGRWGSSVGVAADFKKFLLSGNLVSMAVAFVVGLAIVALIGALVTDIIDPLIGAAGHVNFSALGVLTVNHSQILGGSFLGAIINFAVLMTVVFFAIAYPYQLSQDRKKAKATPTTRPCPECCSVVDLKAKRCPFCTQPITPA